MEFDTKYFNSFIKNSKYYFAHLPKKAESSKQPELLSEHSALVFAYMSVIIKSQSLNGVINNLVEYAIPYGMNKNILKTLILDLFYKSIAYHDLGKVNKEFQVSRMRNKSNILTVSHSFNSKHSIIGVYIFLADFFSLFLQNELTDEECVYICNVALYLSYSIFKHHAPCLNESQDETIWNNKDLFALKPYLSLFQISLNEEQINLFHNCFLNNANFTFFFDRYDNVIKESNTFPLYALCKLNYSLLTASDYLATAHYMNNWKEMYSDFGLINDSLRERIIYNAENYIYNKPVFDAIKLGLYPNLDLLNKQSNGNINELRKSIAIEVVQNIRIHNKNNLFYIEAPTGSGKTNLSILALAELLRTDKNKLINKVFYVFPFTTLITQTYSSLSETLGLRDCEIAEIHSKASFQTRNYEDDYLNYLDNLFVNYPVSLLSHIRFFDVLKTNDKETNYLLHRMANSIVVIDEIQSYSPKTWDKVIYFINNYAKYFNMKFIIMSATLPKIGNLVNEKELASDFVYLVNDKSKYFQNPNFCKRVSFDYSLLNKPMPDKDSKTDYLQELKDFVFEKSEKYAVENKHYPNSVHTIIEFIFKKTASEFYSIIKTDNHIFDEVFLLSSTILEPRRKKIIDSLKSSDLRKKRVLLISTQVVEAGVNIDMDLGFKDKSIVDSEEQLAGRINRNVKKSDCKLYIFNCDSAKTLYGKDDRFEVMQNNFVLEDYKNILRTKNFDLLYKEIIEECNSRNKNPWIENIQDLKNSIATLNYQKVNNQLELIKSLNDSVFVPIDIPFQYLKEDTKILDDLEIVYRDVVKGLDVWKSYENVIKSQDENFVKSKIQMKKLQGLMSNFTFSIFRGGKDYDILSTYGLKQYGYLYLDSYSKIYSFEDGIITDKFENNNFL